MHKEQNCAKVKIRLKQADMILVQAKFLSQDKILGNRLFYKGLHNGPAARFAAQIDLRRTTPM